MNGVESNMNAMKVKMNDMDANMEAKMNGMDTKMNGMENKMGELKINLNKLLQKMVTNGERVVNKTHNEKKINVNHDFIYSNVGLKTHDVPKIDMRKVYRKDPKTWILHMDKFLDLHNVKSTQKLRIATLYLEPNHFAWYR